MVVGQRDVEDVEAVGIAVGFGPPADLADMLSQFDSDARNLRIGSHDLDGGFRGWIMADEWEVPDPYDACLKCKRAIDSIR